MSLFCCRENPPKRGALSFIIVGAAVTFIILAVMAIPERGRAPASPSVQSKPVSSPAGIISAYKIELSKLKQALAEEKDSTAATALIEKTLFEIRVPQEFLGVHFDAVLAVRALKDTKASEASKSLREILDRLIAAAESVPQ